MSNVKTILMTGVAVLGLAAPVAAQSVSADTATTLGAEAGVSGDSVTADAGIDTGLTTDINTGVSADTTMTAESELTTDTDATTDTEMAADTTLAPAPGTKVGALIGMEVASSAGENIGEIDDVVEINGETMAVVGVGGFLGLGEHDVALPVTELMVEGETITAMGYSREQLKSMAEYNAELATSLDTEQVVSLGQS